jgi:hypothetical protein
MRTPTYHGGVFTTLEDNLERAGGKHDVLDELNIFQHSSRSREAVVPTTKQNALVNM